MSEERYRFYVEWYDPILELKRQFLLNYFPSDGSVDMYDIATKRPFLRRILCNTVNISDLFVGSIINVLSRQLVITGFGDKNTAQKFSQDIQHTIMIINNTGFQFLGKIISILEKNDLYLYRGKIMDKDKYSFNSSSFSEKLKNQFLVIELRGDDAINVVRKLTYSDMPSQRPIKLDLGELVMHCIAPKDSDTASKEVKLFFPFSKEVHCNTAVLKNSTCCIIKPHALREQIAGKIIQDIIDNNFIISAFEIIFFNMSNASEFLEIYKGVVPEYKDMIEQLMSGPCIAIEISSPNENNVFTEFRTYVGPSDPEIARKLRPGTLRAVYGHDKIKNAVHCTDLVDDTVIELDYVFKILHA